MVLILTVRGGGECEHFAKIWLRPITFTNLHSPKIGQKNLHSEPKTFTPVKILAESSKKTFTSQIFRKFSNTLGKPSPGARNLHSGEDSGTQVKVLVEPEKSRSSKTFETFTFVHFLPWSRIKTHNVRFLHIPPRRGENGALKGWFWMVFWEFLSVF